LLVIAACSNGDDDDAGQAEFRPSGGAVEVDEAGDDGSGGAGQPAGEDASGAGSGSTSGFVVDANSAQQLPGADREVIHTADLELETRDVEFAARRATQIARALDGFVLSQEAALLGEPHVVVVVKVPPARFDAALEGLGRLGRVTRRNIDAEDVTTEVVDLEARLATAKSSAARLRELLAHSGTVGDLVTVEQHLTQRESEVESLTGQLRSLRAQVDLATLTASFSERERDRVRPSGDIPGFLRGLRAGAVSFVNVAQVAATVIGFLLPYLGLALLIGVPVVAIRRRR